MIRQDFSDLTGKVLIASPYTMEGNVFHQSLIYVVHHGAEGSVGFIFNRPFNNTTTSNLFKKIDPDLDFNLLKLDIHIGGPVELERGFFLHSTDYNKNLLFKLENSELAVSSNLEILRDITQNKGPEFKLFMIGYTGWSAGQIEFEIQNNLWIVADPDFNIIFSRDNTIKWTQALTNLDINGSDFIPVIARG